MAGLQFKKFGLNHFTTNNTNNHIFSFLVQSNLAKLEDSKTVILPPYVELRHQNGPNVKQILKSKDCTKCLVTNTTLKALPLRLIP